jgi:hypothetical protein
MEVTGGIGAMRGMESSAAAAGDGSWTRACHTPRM